MRSTKFKRTLNGFYIVIFVLLFSNITYSQSGSDTGAIDIGYFTLKRVMDSAASSVYDDPIIRLINNDFNFKLHLNVVESDEAVNLDGYDIIVIQESFGSASEILKPYGSLGLPNLKVPVLINKSWAWREGRMLTSPAAHSANHGNNYLWIDPDNQDNPLFNGIIFDSSNIIKTFQFLANDDGGQADATRSNNYAAQNTISNPNTLLAYPVDATSDVSICYNDLPKGTIVDSDTLKSHTITIGNNFGAMCAFNGKNFTSEGITIWRNALYMLAGLDVPEDLIIMDEINPDTNITDTINHDTLCYPAFFNPSVMYKNNTYMVEVHFSCPPKDSILYFVLRKEYYDTIIWDVNTLPISISEIYSSNFYPSQTVDSMYYAIFTIPDYVEIGEYNFIAGMFDGMNISEVHAETKAIINEYYEIDYPEICMVTVTNDNKNKIIWKQPDPNVDSVVILREGSVLGQYNIIGTVNAQYQNYYIDKEANPRQHANTYVIEYKYSSWEVFPLIDCYNCIFWRSTPHTTIHLTMNVGIDFTVNLNWSEYNGLPIQTYYVYRSINKTGYVKIAELSASVHSFSDINPPIGILRYKIGFPAINSCLSDSSILKSSKEIIVESNSVENNGSTSVNISQNENFNIYPNPVNNGVIFIEPLNDLGSDNNLIVNLLGYDGKILFNKKIENPDSKLEIDVSGLDRGIYLLRIECGNNTVKKKIMINY